MDAKQSTWTEKIVYLFTPEDSTFPVGTRQEYMPFSMNGGLGSVKAILWAMLSLLVACGLSLL